MEYQDFHNEMNTYYYRADCYHTMRQPDNDATSGNHHVINATYHLISSKLNEGYPSTVEGMIDYNNQYTFLANTMVEPGLYVRHPMKAKDNQAHDDYIGLLVSSKIFNLDIANVVYDYGQTRRFLLKNYFDTLKESNFKFNSWFGRFGWLTAINKAAADKQLNIVDKFSYVIYLLEDVYFNTDKSSTSGKILKWLSFSVIKNKSKLIDWAINKYIEYIKQQYKDGQMGEVLGIYHGMEHPFSKAMWGKI